jgi:sugar phosphate isomerase/epimerase
MYFSTNLDGFVENRHYVENAGFDLIETYGIKHFELHARPEMLDINNPQEIAEINRIFKACGWILTSLHAPAWQGPYDLSDLDEESRKTAVWWNVQTMRAVKELGGTYCVTHAGDRVEDETERPERLQQSMKSLSELTVEAEKMAIILSLENVLDPYICRDLSETLFFQEKIISPWLRPVFDVGHAFLSDGLQPWFDILPDFNWQSVHVTDNHGRIRNTSNDDEHLFPFEGIIPWATVFDCVKQIGFDGPVTIETKIKPELFAKLKNIVY